MGVVHSPKVPDVENGDNSALGVQFIPPKFMSWKLGSHFGVDKRWKRLGQATGNQSIG